MRAPNATYEMPFGYAERPTHYSTSWDRARYEVPGHRFADLSEHGFGVALLTDSKYGYSCYGNELRLSLLRSPKSPDPEADMGRHEFAYALMPHAGGWREAGVVAEAARFNAPLRWTAASPVESFAAVDDPNLVLDTIKRAEDSDALVLRLYEAHGARGTARVRLGVAVRVGVPGERARGRRRAARDRGRRDRRPLPAARDRDGEGPPPLAATSAATSASYAAWEAPHEDESRHLGARPDDHPLRPRRLPAGARQGAASRRRCTAPSSGLGDLMDDYEFHYPGELNRDNLDEVRAALDGHGIYAVAGGLHVDPRFARGGLTSLDDSVRARGARLLLEAADLAGDIEAQMIVWPGGEGYNYPFQVPYAEVWSRLIDGHRRRSPSGSRSKGACSSSSTRTPSRR